MYKKWQDHHHQNDVFDMEYQNLEKLRLDYQLARNDVEEGKRVLVHARSINDVVEVLDIVRIKLNAHGELERVLGSVRKSLVVLGAHPRKLSAVLPRKLSAVLPRKLSAVLPRKLSVVLPRKLNVDPLLENVLDEQLHK